jgi:putative transposase
LPGKDDRLTKVDPLLSIIPAWKEFLTLSSEEELAALRKHERSGRPLGPESFIEKIETTLLRQLRPQKRGPKPRGW